MSLVLTVSIRALMVGLPPNYFENAGPFPNRTDSMSRCPAISRATGMLGWPVFLPVDDRGVSTLSALCARGVHLFLVYREAAPRRLHDPRLQGFALVRDSAINHDSN